MLKERFLKKGFLAALLLLILLFAGVCQAAELSFGWSPNSESDLAGYKIYYGPTTRGYAGYVDVKIPPTNAAGQVTAMVEIPYGNRFFAATAYNAEGFESDFSNEATAAIPPAAPGGFVTSKVSITYHLVPEE